MQHGGAVHKEERKPTMKRTTLTATLQTFCRSHAAGMMAVVMGGMLGGVLSGCAILPSTATSSKSKWQTYEDAHKAYDTVVLDKTTKADLQFLGFTPDGNANVKILNYVDVGNLFGSSFRPEDLPNGVKTCFAAQDGCVGYVVAVRNIKNKRDGNVAADLFGFRKNTHITGFEFQATLVLVNDRVVYKLWNGIPAVESFERQSTPLGPMQNLGGIIPKPY
jgi:hypothetical protein